MTLPVRRLLNAYYAMTAERLAHGDMINPFDDGTTRLDRFEQMLDEPEPGGDDWGNSDTDEAAFMAMLGG